MAALVHPLERFALVHSIFLIGLTTSPAPVSVASCAFHMQAAGCSLCDKSARWACSYLLPTFLDELLELGLDGFLAVDVWVPLVTAVEAHISIASGTIAWF